MEKMFLQVEVLRVRLGLVDPIWQRFPNLLFLKDDVPLFCALGQSVLICQRRAELERSEQSKELVSSYITVSLVWTYRLYQAPGCSCVSYYATKMASLLY